ncbi:hypothetical protein E2C01_047718 [Portunus trituberculatus]|uniref:Uncharacterized protein n=1 Tax=Portunus trituberculatus TaxID=210409 RepID=A0A5B7G8I5_PORTR|nr:hypothetical protein [Portunus trituberculatus]
MRGVVESTGGGGGGGGGGDGGGGAAGGVGEQDSSQGQGRTLSSRLPQTCHAGENTSNFGPYDNQPSESLYHGKETWDVSLFLVAATLPSYR